MPFFKLQGVFSMKRIAFILIGFFLLALTTLPGCAVVATNTQPYPVVSPAPAATPDISDYCVPAYADRYSAYAAKNPELSERQVVIAVNLRLDHNNYQHVVLAEDPDSVRVFISKHYGVPEDYRPDTLVSVDRKYAQSGVTLRKDCYDAFLVMARDMEKEGLSLYMKSGYRVNRKRRDPDSLWYAWPGHSEHQTGLAFDLRKKGVSYPTLSEYRYEKTEEYAWLCQHAHRYGFILSYPKDKTDITGIGFEPWHWRYVGADIATDMKQKEYETYHEYWATHFIMYVVD